MEEFKLPLQLLKFCGFDRYASNRENICLQIFIFWNFISTFYFMLCSAIFVYKSNDLLGISESMAPNFTAIYTIVKYIILYRHINQFYEAMDEITGLNEKWINMSSHNNILLQVNKKCKRFTRILGYGCLFVGTIYIAKPNLLDFFNYLSYGTPPVRELPLKAEYFYDVTTSPGYELAYFLHAWLAWFLIITTITLSSIFCSYCFNISAHFEILRKIIHYTEVEDFAVYHQKVIKVTKKCANLYRPILFAEFIIMAIVLCFTGLQIVTYNDFGKILSPLIHGMTAFSDVVIYSYGAQKVLDSALAVCDEVYKIDKNYIVIMAVTQKELKFDCWLFRASLHTLTSILNRTISIITLLKSFIKN